MEIKKLPKEIIEEGITVSLVNSINMKTCYSPVQMEKGDTPVKLVPCSTGFWVLYDGINILKDTKGLMVFTEKACRIARARYLVNYGKKEKSMKVKILMKEWKDKVRESIDKVKKEVTDLEKWNKEPSNDGSLDLGGILASHNPERYKMMKNAALLDLERRKPLLEKVEKMWDDGRIIELMMVFKIKKFEGFGEPMLSAQYDNEHDMKVLINTFGGEALKKWDGDMLSRYATMEIEKEYPI